MKLTKQQLKEVIKEEINSMLGEDEKTNSSVFHACASHVSPKGLTAFVGEVLSHTLTEDGTVEHYDVKFGSRTFENIPAGNLDIVKERHHSHTSEDTKDDKKKK